MTEKLMQEVADAIAPANSVVTWLDVEPFGDISDVLERVTNAMLQGDAPGSKTHYIIIRRAAISEEFQALKHEAELAALHGDEQAKAAALAKLRELAGQGKSQPKPQPPPQPRPDGTPYPKR